MRTMRNRIVILFALCSGAIFAEPDATGLTTNQAITALRHMLLDPNSEAFIAMQYLAASAAKHEVESDSFEVDQARRVLDELLVGVVAIIDSSRAVQDDEGKILEEFVPLYGKVLSTANSLKDVERRAFLDRVLSTALICQTGGKALPDELLVHAAKMVGGSKLLRLHAQHQVGVIHVLLVSALLYVAFRGVRFATATENHKKFNPHALVHYIFGEHVDSFGDGVVDALFTPVQLMRHPVATPVVKPLLCAAVLGAAVGLGAHALVQTN